MTFAGVRSVASSAAWVWRRPWAWTRLSIPARAASLGSSVADVGRVERGTREKPGRRVRQKAGLNQGTPPGQSLLGLLTGLL